MTYLLAAPFVVSAAVAANASRKPLLTPAEREFLLGLSVLLLAFPVALIVGWRAI